MTDRQKSVIDFIKYALAGGIIMAFLSGCGAAMQATSAQGAFEQTLKDGRVVQCVQSTGHAGDVSIDCDFENAK